jgi:hypothetical protein
MFYTMITKTLQFHMKKPLVVLLIIFLFTSDFLIAQDRPDKENTGKQPLQRASKPKDPAKRVTRINFGINIGMYDANKYPANFYNGGEWNVNKVSYVMSNYYWYQDIKRSLGLGATDTVVASEFPMNMRYKVVISGGVFVRVNLSRFWGLCMDANYTQLKAEDVVTFLVNPQYNYTFPDIRLIPISGTEERIHFDLLLQRNFWLKSKIYFFAQGGLNMNYTRVLKSIIYVDQEYSLINIYSENGYVPNTNLQTYEVFQGGIGYGLNLGGGVGVPLADMFGIEPGGFINYNNVRLEGYPDFKLSFGFYVRILFGNIRPHMEDDENR